MFLIVACTFQTFLGKSARFLLKSEPCSFLCERGFVCMCYLCKHRLILSENENVKKKIIDFDIFHQMATCESCTPRR